MQVAIHVTYWVDVEEDDAEKIETGEMSADDLDWSYYITEASEIELDCIDVL